VAKSEVYLLDATVLIAVATPEHSLNARRRMVPHGTPICDLSHNPGCPDMLPPARQCGGNDGLRETPAGIHYRAPCASILAR
jgi:hypothetical protein